ncbi:MAG TPA: biotin--[acetyl-CoA-carboxylase] ligase [Dehalococcoidia bacterium]|nr:biotin--[acetyl-CoA-carboxylase] ligase [Dehalococcoidia bacterium]
MDTPLDIPTFQQRLTTHSLGRRFEYQESVGSTQDLARSLAQAGAPEGTVVFAEEQTAGRGRLGRGWESPPRQNIYLTLVLRPPAAALRKLSMLAPLAIAEAVEDETGLTPDIKWPNDVLLGERKLAGVLIDTQTAGEEVYALLGLGVNVNLQAARHPQIAAIATSLREELGRAVAREPLLTQLLGRLEQLYEALLAGDSPYQAWRSRLVTLGQTVNVRHGDTTESGLAEDVDEEGALLLRRSNGTLIALDAGEVTLTG